MTRFRWMIVVGIVVSTIGCDRVTKRLAEERLASGARHSFLADTLRLEYVENKGGFLGLGAGLPAVWRTGLFTLGTAVMLAGVAVVLARHRVSVAWLLGLSLLWAGGVANLIDRLAGGSVVDFLNLGVGPLRTGIFNVADLAITLGAALLVLRRSGLRGAALDPVGAEEGSREHGSRV